MGCHKIITVFTRENTQTFVWRERRRSGMVFAKPFDFPILGTHFDKKTNGTKFFPFIMMKCFVQQNRGKTAWQKFRFSWFYRIFRPVARTNQSCLQAGSRQSKRFANRYCLCSKAGHHLAKVERNFWRILAVNLQQLRSKRFCHLLGLLFMLNTIGIYGNAVWGIVFFQAYATRQAISWSQKKQDSQNLKCCDDNSFPILSHCCNVMGHLIPQSRICSNNSISRFAIPRLAAILRQPLMAFVTSPIILVASSLPIMYSSEDPKRRFKSDLLVEELMRRLWYSLEVGFMS